MLLLDLITLQSWYSFLLFKVNNLGIIPGNVAAELMSFFENRQRKEKENPRDKLNCLNRELHFFLRILKRSKKLFMQLFGEPSRHYCFIPMLFCNIFSSQDSSQTTGGFTRRCSVRAQQEGEADTELATNARMIAKQEHCHPLCSQALFM